MSFEKQELADKNLQVGKDSEVVGKDKEEHGPSEDHPRFKKVYGKMKEFERSIQEKDVALQALKQRNEELGASLENLSKKVVETTDKKTSDDFNQKIHDLTVQMEEVYDEDPKKAMKIQTEITRLQIERNSPKPLDVNDLVAKVTEGVSKKFSRQQGNEDFDEWVTENQWYTKDPVLQAAAKSFVNGLPQGLGMKDVLKKTSDFIKRAYPETDFGENPDFNSTETGEFLNMKIPDALTVDEKKLADMCGIPHKAWLTQKQNIVKGHTVGGGR